MRYRLAWILLCIALAAGVSACRKRGPIQQTMTSETVTPEQMALCAEKMNITFPPSTEPLYFFQETGVHNTIWLKARIDTKEIQALIRQSPFAGQPLRNNRQAVSSPPGLDWWQPDRAKSYLSGETGLPDGSTMRILIDRSDPAKAVVYLQWYAM